MKRIMTDRLYDDKSPQVIYWTTLEGERCGEPGVTAFVDPLRMVDGLIKSYCVDPNEILREYDANNYVSYINDKLLEQFNIFSKQAEEHYEANFRNKE